MEFLQHLGQLDGESLAVLAAAVALLGLLFGVADSWRRIQREADDLPLWQVLHRAHISLRAAEGGAGTRALRQAELRCMLCAGRAQCGQRVAAAGMPLEDCPNLRLVATLRRWRPEDGAGNTPTPYLT